MTTVPRPGITALAYAVWLALGIGMPAAAADSTPRTNEQASQPSAPDFPIKRHIRYSFTLQNEVAQPLSSGRLAVYAPVRQTSSQRLEALTSSHPAQVQADPWGNQVLRFDLDALAPYASRVVTIDAELALADRAQPQPATEGELRVFTRPEPYVESDHPRIVTIAKTLRAKSPRETARNTFDWVRQSLGRSAFTAEDRGALRALADKTGDCTEHAYLVVALLRANDIPARVIGGYLMPESGLVRAHDYHNWAEFYLNGAWHVADAHQGNFDRNASRYVATRVLSSSVPSPLGGAHRFAATGNGLKVTMN